MSEDEADPLAMPTGREATAFDNRDLVRHVRVLGIVGDAVNTALRDDLPRFELLVHGPSPVVRTSSFGNGPCAAMFRGSGFGPDSGCQEGCGLRQPNLA